MDRENRSDGGCTDSSANDPTASSSTRADVEVMGSYDDIDGTPVYVIAALDGDGAWIAVADGDELEVTDWA